MRVRIRSLLSFYQSFLFVSLIIDLVCIFVIWKTNFNLFMAMLWFKIVAMAIVIFYISEYRHRDFYYYQNIGISKRFLWLGTLSMDFLSFFFSSFLIYKLR
jgi:hypothetical protein